MADTRQNASAPASLDPVYRQRYDNKIKDINGEDPYNMPKDKWANDCQCYPDITFPDIVAYLVCRTSFYTAEQFKACKRLSAYDNAYNGWVQVVETYRPPSYKFVVLRAKVLHSQVSEKSLLPLVIVEEEGTAISGHCTCMASLVEACAHIAALLFYVETCVSIQEKETATGKPVYWKPPPGLKKVEPARAASIDFTSCAAQRKNL